MAINYTWKVTSIKTRAVDSLSDVVIQTHWEKSGVDENGNEGKFSGATPFKEVDPISFIPYAELTEAKVLEWIQAVVIGTYEEHVNEQIQKQIDAKTIVVKTDLPWAVPETSATTPDPVQAP